MSSSIFNFEAYGRAWRSLKTRPLACLGAGLASASLLVLANVLLVTFYDAPNWKTKAVEALSPELEVLNLGSSRVYFGIDPEKLGRPAMNLAANYLDAVHMERLWEVHGPRLTGLQAVTIEMEIVSLHYDTLRHDAKGLRDLGLDLTPGALDFLEDFDGALRRLLYPVFTWRLTPRFHALHAEKLAAPEEPTAQRAGFVPSTLSVSFAEVYARREIEKARREMQGEGEAVFARNEAALGRLIGHLNARGLVPWLVRYPLHPAARPIYPKDWNERASEVLKRLEAGHRFHFLDLSAMEGLEDGDFRDPDHLNAAGAAKLSAHLGRLLDEGK
jgi:hypothetical protein